MSCKILLTFDVEDWFQVQNFMQCIPFSSWPRCELRVEKNTHLILDLLDNVQIARKEEAPLTKNSSLSTNNSALSTRNSAFITHNSALVTHNSLNATFFVLGWIAERLPHLVREIQARGHEVGSHGYFHRLCREEPVSALKRDLMDSKKLLEDITGTPVYGYRAPSFSINDDVLNLIEDCGYSYDSSFNSFALNKRYGEVNFARNGKKGIASQMSNTFYELPISNLRLGKHVLPWGGGGYFRLIPLPLFKLGVQWILEKEKAYLL